MFKVVSAAALSCLALSPLLFSAEFEPGGIDQKSQLPRENVPSLKVGEDQTQGSVKDIWGIKEEMKTELASLFEENGGETPFQSVIEKVGSRLSKVEPFLRCQLFFSSLHEVLGSRFAEYLGKLNKGEKGLLNILGVSDDQINGYD